jgi:hypothetical protein
MIGANTVTGSRRLVAFGWQKFEGSKRTSEICLVDRTNGTILNRIPIASAITLAFSHDGNKLAVLGNGSLGQLDLTDPSPSFRPLFGGTNPVGGDMGDAHLVWSHDDRRLIVSNSLRPIEVYDASSGSLLAWMAMYGSGKWLAVGTDGTIDGSPNGVPVVLEYRDGRWTKSERRASFFMRLLGSTK